MSNPSILILPGYGDSGPDHWQTLWEHRLAGARRVQQRDWLAPSLDDWLPVLVQEIHTSGGGVVLVAHSLACLLVAALASRGSPGVRGALLVAPPDPQGPLFPDSIQGFFPIYEGPLGFPAIVVASTDDPYATPAFSRRCAEGWGARLVEIHDAGHINSASDLGEWPAGLALLDELLRS